MRLSMRGNVLEESLDSFFFYKLKVQIKFTRWIAFIVKGGKRPVGNISMNSIKFNSWTHWSFNNISEMEMG